MPKTDTNMAKHFTPKRTVPASSSVDPFTVLVVWAVPVKNPRILIAYLPGTDPSNPNNLVTVLVRDNRTFMLNTRLKATKTDRDKVYNLVGSIPKWRGQKICP
jgi:hypothetical protein